MEEWEEKFEKFTKDSNDKSAGMTKELEKYLCDPQLEVPTFLSDIARRYTDTGHHKDTSRISKDTGSLVRPSSGRREFISTFNSTAAAGASPRAFADHSEVRRVYVGMSKGE